MTLIPTVPNSLKSIPIEPVYFDMADLAAPKVPLAVNADLKPAREVKTAPIVSIASDYAAATPLTFVTFAP